LIKRAIQRCRDHHLIEGDDFFRVIVGRIMTLRLLGGQGSDSG
jgi:hypothetical protein